MKHINFKTLKWTNQNNIESVNIWENSENGGMTYWTVHKGYEHIILIEGKMNFSNTILTKGDCLITQKDEEHESIALEDSIILVIGESKNS
ncbi:MAG: hypothetical protein MJK08_00785 [Campylobacterales bacterium]|nr:hypothetical protein [Campylobacterales bacterium]